MSREHGAGVLIKAGGSGEASLMVTTELGSPEDRQRVRAKNVRPEDILCAKAGRCVGEEYSPHRAQTYPTCSSLLRPVHPRGPQWPTGRPW